MASTSSSAPKRQISLVAALVVAVATPATLALSFFQLTGMPGKRPLAITLEEMIESGDYQGGPLVHATVTFDGSRTGNEQAMRLAQKLIASFYGKGAEARVTIVPQPGQTDLEITFNVGKSRLGPYTVANAAAGVSAAVQAADLVGQNSPARAPAD